MAKGLSVKQKNRLAKRLAKAITRPDPSTFTKGKLQHRAKQNYRAGYRAYLYSLQWDRFRTAIFEQRGKQCERCQSTQRLQLHHKTYVRVKAELPSDVIILCRACHEHIHGISKVPKSKNGVIVAS